MKNPNEIPATYAGFPHAHIKGLKQYSRKKPVLGWNAISKYTGKLLKTHNLRGVLQAEFGDSCDYKPIY